MYVDDLFWRDFSSFIMRRKKSHLMGSVMLRERIWVHVRCLALIEYGVCVFLLYYLSL